MNDVDFDWDHHNIAHIARHGVTPEEVEQVLANNPVFIETQTDQTTGEARNLETGTNDQERILIIVWTCARADFGR